MPSKSPPKVEGVDWAALVEWLIAEEGPVKFANRLGLYREQVFRWRFREVNPNRAYQKILRSEAQKKIRRVGSDDLPQAVADSLRALKVIPSLS